MIEPDDSDAEAESDDASDDARETASGTAQIEDEWDWLEEWQPRLDFLGAGLVSAALLVLVANVVSVGGLSGGTWLERLEAVGTRGTFWTFLLVAAGVTSVLVTRLPSAEQVDIPGAAAFTLLAGGAVLAVGILLEIIGLAGVLGAFLDAGLYGVANKFGLPPGTGQAQWFAASNIIGQLAVLLAGMLAAGLTWWGWKGTTDLLEYEEEGGPYVPEEDEGSMVNTDS